MGRGRHVRAGHGVGGQSACTQLYGVVSGTPRLCPVTVVDVSLMRRCSRTACGRAAVATLTYVYGEQTAVLGPLATFAEPHTYDLCSFHAERLTAPQGWELVRLATHFREAPEGADDLLAVADAVREHRDEPTPESPDHPEPSSPQVARAAGSRGPHPLPGGSGHPHGHLRILREE